MCILLFIIFKGVIYIIIIIFYSLSLKIIKFLWEIIIILIIIKIII